MPDTITIDENGDTSFTPQEILTGRGFITGKSGSGKSNSASVIIEHLLEQGHPIFIVDTDGEYWGLKEQYQLLHVGAGADVDHQVGPEHAEWLAEKALYDNIPVILDVSAYIEQDEVDELVHQSLHHLFVKENEARRPFLTVIEEIQEYVPQSGSLGDVGRTIVRIAKRGRKRGLGTIGISQRPANVDKNFITQCDWVLWHLLTWDSDFDVVRDVVNTDVAEAVSGLDTGEAFLTGDLGFLDDPLRVRVSRKRTYDAAETPDLEDHERPELQSIGEALSDELDEISRRQQERQDEIERLNGVIADRDDRIGELEEELERERIATSTAERIANAVASGGGGDTEAVQEQIEAIRDEKNQEITELTKTKNTLENELSEVRSERDDLRDRVSELEDQVEVMVNIDELREAVGRMGDVLGLEFDGDVAAVRERVREREARIRELESEVTRLQARSGGVDLGEFEEIEDFLEHDAVRAAIEDAKDDDRAVPKYVSAILASIVDTGGPVTYREVADRVGISDKSNISSKGATPLASRGVIEKDKEGGETVVGLNTDGIEDIIRLREKRERTAELVDQF